jgi:hypothetical protein
LYCTEHADTAVVLLTLGDVHSAFFWLLSILVVSTVGAIRPLRAFLPVMLPFGVLVQELFRWVYFRGFAGLCHLLRRGTPSIEFSVHEQLGVAVGKLQLAGHAPVSAQAVGICACS